MGSKTKTSIVTNREGFSYTKTVSKKERSDQNLMWVTIFLVLLIVITMTGLVAFMSLSKEPDPSKETAETSQEHIDIAGTIREAQRAMQGN